MPEIHYEKLSETDTEIRLLTIAPASSSSATSVSSGRRTVLKGGVTAIAGTRWKTSAVHINTNDDLVYVSLETFSLSSSYTDEYRAYQATASNSNETWEHFSLPQSQISDCVKLPGWRGPGVRRGHSRDHVPTLDWPVLFRPRYSWGDYEALSYTWGLDDRSGRIYINGILTPVQKNVEDALRRLRALPETRHGMKYWIDAICINQTDISERNEQVKKMKDLYKNAWSVVAWLGEETEDCNEAVDIIASMAHLTHNSRNMDRSTFEFHFRDVRWNQLLSLFQRPYWRRLWVIQELALNAGFTIFLCGDRAFYRQELETILTICFENYGALRQMVSVGNTRIGQGATPQQVDPPMSYQKDPWDIVYYLHTLLFSSTTNLDHTFILSQQAQASDDRDKIYGILGLLPDRISSMVIPRYELSIRRVYQNFAYHLFHSEGLSSLLSWASGLETTNLPSWSPDWTKSNPRNHIRWLRKRKAKGPASFSSRISEDLEELICEGLKVDAIDCVTTALIQSSDLVSSRIEEPVGPPANSWPRIRDSMLINALKATLLMDHPGSESLSNSILEVPWVRYQDHGDSDMTSSSWRTLWKDIDSQGLFGAFDKFRKANAAFPIGGHQLQHFFPELLPYSHFYKPGRYTYPGAPQADDRDSLHVAHDIGLAAIALVGRRLLSTSSGCLGLAPATAQAGDIVAIVDSPFPIVLRPNGDYFRYIGECYIYGLMDGEAFNENGTPKFPTWEFRIV